ncbi:C4-dicarboxylate ABC transporter substrate-binding protein [uncultured Gammaproteobacteria bacterium]
MRGKLSMAQVRELALVAGPAILVVLAAFWIAAQFVTPAPPKEITIAAAAKGSPYYETAQRYRQVLAESGIELKVRETSGSMENLDLIKDPNSNVVAAFLQGGLANSNDAPDVRSLGRIFHEPVWIFYQGQAKLERLTDLVGKRVLIGPAGSGTAALATRLLAASGVTKDTATLITMGLPDYVEALDQNKADAGVLVLAPEARTVKRLFDNPKIRLMNVVQADAYVQRFPFLLRVELKEGVVDFARDIPPADTQMLATTTGLVIKEDLHPALANLLTQAAVSIHRQPKLNANGEAGIFQRAGSFPIANDQEFPMSLDAVHVYKSGSPFLQRYLPFWLATLVDRLMVMLLPAIGILLPAVRGAQALYTWRIRRRLFYWYSELVKVDAEVYTHSAPDQIAETIRKIDLIQDAVNRLPIPLGFVDQLYNLRGHINVVRHGLLANRTNAGSGS